ncbi:MAG: PRTRC system ParB family protein [Halothiobacillus sp.]|nr:PRTRC system ParB family protein [Halothiobacillus sp.]
MTLENTHGHGEDSTTSSMPSFSGSTNSITPPAHEDGDLQYIDLSLIGMAPNFNPRSYFEPMAMQELVDSIKEQGLIQPITVRPATEAGQYYLVAGERRYRACQAAGLQEIPVIIRLLSDEAAFEMATTENTVREDMSIAEEAKAARRVLSARNGDRQDAAKKLGWSIGKLNSRLALLHATEPVLTALTERRIKIGHAELLASLDDKMQEGTLKAILQNNISVNELRDKLGAFSQELSNAVFNTSDCAGCPFNSTEQASLFDEHIGVGRCTNRACWSDKEHDFAVTKRDELTGTYPLVKLDTESDPEHRTILMLDDVGREQFMSCKGCANFGCEISTKPGSVGLITKDVCFDVACNSKMAKAYKDSIKSLSDPIPASAKNPADSTKSTRAATAAKPEKSKASTDRAATPKRVLDKVCEIQTNAAYSAVVNDKTMMLVVAATELVREAFRSGTKPYVAILEKSLKDHGVSVSAATQRDVILGVFGKMANEGRAAEIVDIYTKAVAALACRTDAAFENEPKKRIKSVQVVLNIANVDLQSHFKLDKDFLGSHTKSGIESLMAEAGFIAWYDTKNGEGSFKKLMSKKNDELVDAILAAGFDFSAFLPQAVKVTA